MASKYFKDSSFEDRLSEEFPIVKKLKPAWNLANGETDIFVENLRADRRNKGLTYKTNYIPFIGTSEAVEFKFRAGEENSVSFESDYIPFAGRVDGFNIKGSVGDDSKIFARYTVKFD